MRKIFFLSNSKSGSFDAETCKAIHGAFDKFGWTICNSCDFPDQDAPSADALHASEADLMVVYAGDGTINHAVATLEGWPGEVLVLPGGTMNLLPKLLHGDATADAILDIVARDEHEIARLPCVEVGDHHALVGFMAGPLTAWNDVRESVRERDFSSLPAKLGDAIQRTLNDPAIHVAGMEGHEGSVVLVAPQDDALDLSLVAGVGAGEVASIGWNWITGEWRNAASVEQRLVGEAAIHMDGGLTGLIDGEPVELPADIVVRHGHSRTRFIRTLRPAATQPVEAGEGSSGDTALAGVPPLVAGSGAL